MTEKSFFVHPSSIIDDGAEIGKGTSVWHFCHVMGDSKLGEKCVLGQNVFIANGVQIGNNVKIQNNVSVYKGVICEDDVFLGPSMVFTNVVNPRSAVNRKTEYSPTIVRKGVSIGANVTIVCGVELGRYAFIGAGAVVTKDVPAYALMVANPAKQIGWMSEFGERLEFENGAAICEHTGAEYVIKDGKVSKK